MRSTLTNFRVITLAHKFVEFIPEELAERVLYISVIYGTASHRCACGCGRKVVTPLTPTDWKLIFDGETVSLYPSIGNWTFACRSHYWVKNSQVLWAGPLARHPTSAVVDGVAKIKNGDLGNSVPPSELNKASDKPNFMARFRKRWRRR